VLESPFRTPSLFLRFRQRALIKCLSTRVKTQPIRQNSPLLNRDENLENYDCEVQMYTRAHSMPRLANWNHLRLSVRTKLRREFRVRKVQNALRAILLLNNHTVFLVQFGINLHLWVIQRAEIALAQAPRTISAFWITHSCKFIPKLNSKTYHYLYKLHSTQLNYRYESLLWFQT